MMKDFPNIREYEPEDKESVKGLYRDAEYLEPTFSKLDDPHYKKFLYVEEDVKGIIILAVPYLTLKIYNLWVDEDSRGRGVGSRLIEFAEDYCKKKDLDGIRVATMHDNERAQEFYQKTGFEKAGKVRNYNVEGETMVFFYKSVNDF